MKRQTYDVALKMSIASEYEAGHETYSTLASKYNVPRSTIISLLMKARLYNSFPSTTPNTQERFLSVTPRLQEIPQSIQPEK